jgi:beta-lactamase class A
LNDATAQRIIDARAPTTEARRGELLADPAMHGPRVVRALSSFALIMAITAVALLAAALSAAVAPAHAQDPTATPGAEPVPLCDRIDELASDAHDRLQVDLGVSLVDLTTGEACEVRATRIFRSASLYKLVVMAEAYRQQDELGLDFEEMIELLPRHSLDDPPSLRLTEPVELTRAEAIERMITFSDNPSAEALRELLGPGLVQDAPAWLGLEQTSLGMLFYTSPRDMARFFAALYAGEVVSPEASQAMLDLLLRQEINDLIPVGVEEGVPIAHKTGLLDRHLHDAGIVYAPAGPYVLVALTEHQEDIDAAYEAVQALSALIYEGYATPPVPLLVAPLPEVTPPPTQVAQPTPTATPAPPEVAATATPSAAPPSPVSGREHTTGVRTLLILGAAGAASLAFVSLIMLIARQRHTDPY